VHDDADEAVVAVQPQSQHRQHGLGGDRHHHGVGELQAPGGAEFLAVQEQAAQASQLGGVGSVTAPQEGVANEGALPQIVGDGAARHGGPLAPRTQPLPPAADDHASAAGRWQARETVTGQAQHLGAVAGVQVPVAEHVALESRRQRAAAGPVV